MRHICREKNKSSNEYNLKPLSIHAPKNHRDRHHSPDSVTSAALAFGEFI